MSVLLSVNKLMHQTECTIWDLLYKGRVKRCIHVRHEPKLSVVFAGYPALSAIKPIVH